MKTLIEKLKALRLHFVRRSYSYNDMIWAFEQGIHEGKLREHYKNKPTEFSVSELEYYVRCRK
jgi:hypothetical protein